MEPQSLETDLVDPRGKGEDAWLELLDQLVQQLSQATGCYLHLGTYWVDDVTGHESASLTARVRTLSALIGVESDYWEAAIRFSIFEDQASSNVFAFPFHDASPVLRRGRLADLEPGAEVDEFRWFRWENGGFVDRGWAFPDGPGEWGWIQKPGDEYWEYLLVEPPARPIATGDPIIARIVGLGGTNFRNESSRLSLLFVNRDRENTTLVPWNERPPRSNSQHVLRPVDARFVGNDAELDLSRFNIRGGWLPGNYHLALRAQNFPPKGDWEWQSQISNPFKLTITH